MPKDLNSPISDVVDARVSDTFHEARDAVLFPLLRMRSDYGPATYPLNALHKSVVTTALMETKYSEPDDARRAVWERLLATRIVEFNALTQGQQLGFLNSLWEQCYESVAPQTAAAAMVDSDRFGDTSGQLTSSLRPHDRATARVKLVKGPVDRAWSRFQVGFRIDGGKARNGGARDDLPRVRDYGMKPLVASTPLALQVVKKAYQGLAVSRGISAYLGYQNRDIYNESATCVSRTLVGATAFPYRETVTATDRAALEYHYLFACHCAGLNGCDTEQWQIQRLATWRPGEKAFLGIPAANVLAYTKVIRHGRAPPENRFDPEGWSFEFVDGQWHWLKPGAPAELKAYLEGELGAWTPGVRYLVSGKYDFQC